MARRRSSDFVPHQLDNPLFRKYDEIDIAADAFAISIGADQQLCRKAARIACDPPSWDKVDGLTKDEEEALKNEREESFWQQAKSLRLTIITLCFSAIVQGWIQSVSNGANQTMPEYLGLKNNFPGDADHPANYDWVSRTAIWKFAAINAVTYLTAGFFGCWFSDPVQSSICGRRGAICASACLCIIASIGAASVRRNWWALLIWRALLGVALGAKASVTPIFGAEVSPPHLRGRLVMNWQLLDAFGIFGGFTANLIFYWTNELAWRFQIASACIPAGALLALIYTIPESPRWLLKRGKGPEAFASLCLLRKTPLQAATELFFANAQLQRELEYASSPTRDIETPLTASIDEKGKEAAHIEDINVADIGKFDIYCDAVKSSTYWGRIMQLFRNPRTRRATIAAGVVMLGQQLCGVNVLAFYSTIFIQDINDQTTKNIKALWLSWGLGLANFLFTFPAYRWIDKYGRRFLLLVTYPGMILSLFAACLSFLGDTSTHDDTVRTALISSFMFLFILFYSFGQGPVAFAYAAEVFPLFNREAGMSFAVFTNLVGAGLLTLFVPQAQVSDHTFTKGSFSSQGSERHWLDRQATLLGIFTVLCSISMVLIYFLAPETKLATTREDNRRTLNYISLEELDQIFSVKIRDCRRYYVNHVALRTINNWLHKFGVTTERLRIEDSMYYWSEVRLERKRKQEEAEESETTEVGDVSTDGTGSIVPQGDPASSHAESDTISPAPLPHVVDTGGSINFPSDPPGGDGNSHRQIAELQPRPNQPDPDSLHV